MKLLQSKKADDIFNIYFRKLQEQIKGQNIHVYIFKESHASKLRYHSIILFPWIYKPGMFNRLSLPSILHVIYIHLGSTLVFQVDITVFIAFIFQSFWGISIQRAPKCVSQLIMKHMIKT